MKTKIERGEKTICFSNEKFLERLNHYINFDFSGKSRMKIIASEGHWRLPSSPIVKKNMCCPYVNWQSAKTICFSDKKCWPCAWSLCFLTFAIKAEEK